MMKGPATERGAEATDRGLRERGIYRLPDGQEVVATRCAGEDYCLYAVEAWRAFQMAEYLLGGDGRIIRGGEPTGWQARDLTDIGRTAEYYVLGGVP